MADSKISQLTSGTPTTSDTWVMVQWWVNKKFTFWDLPTPTSVTTALNNKVDKTTTVNWQALSSNVTLTKTDVGLWNVDNTSDINKPISTATQTALNGKQWNITLTTTGTSGAATLIGNTLNIPQYTWGGGWGAVDSVNGQTWAVVLDQDDIWDGTTYKQFSETNRKEIIRSLSTAILTYPTITINVDPTKIDISSFIWRKVDGYTDMENPIITYYTFPWVTWLTITNLATQDTTFLAVNSSWTVDQLTGNDNWANSRDRVIIGSAVHTSRTQVDSIDKFVNVIWYDIANSIADLSDAIGIINTLNKFSANGANMKINKSSWYSTQIGLNIWNSKKSPNRVVDWPLTAASFLYSWRNWSWGFNVLPATSDDIIANKYDDWTWWASIPNGSVSVNRWSLQKLWYISSLSLVVIEYWQATYNTEAEAEAARSTETIVNPALLWASFRWWLIVRGWATNLSLNTDAVFVDSWKFGSTTWWTWSWSSTTTLQQAHDNSALPQITTDSLEIKQKTSDLNNTQVWKNVAWTITASVKWDGSIISKTITITDDTSSQWQVLPDLSNIVRVATTANITLSGTQTIDWVSLVANDLVLVKNQSTWSQNGVYVVSAGAWTRATTYNTTDHFNRRCIYVISGTTNTATLWICSTRNPTVWTTSTSFAQVPFWIGTASNQAAAGNHTHTSIATTSASSIGAALSYRYTNRTATWSTATTDLVVEFTWSTASQIETMPDGVALSNNSWRILVYRNSATVPWTIRQSASNTLDWSASDYTLAVWETLTVLNKADNVWISLNKPVGGWSWKTKLIDLAFGWEFVWGSLIPKTPTPWAWTFNWLTISSDTLPTWSNITIDVKKNGTSILSAPLSITTTEGATNSIYSVTTWDAGKATITTTTFSAKDRLEVIWVPGSTLPWTNVTVQLIATLT